MFNNKQQKRQRSNNGSKKKEKKFKEEGTLHVKLHKKFIKIEIYADGQELRKELDFKVTQFIDCLLKEHGLYHR